MTRGRAVVAALAAGAVLAGAGAAPWVRAAAWTPLDPRADVAASGLEAAPVVGAAALVALAAGVLLALARRRTAVAAGGALGLAGVLAAAGAWGVVAAPGAAARAAARAALGVEEVADVGLTPWPWAALALGAATVVVGVLVARGARGWPVAAGRHDRPAGRPDGPGARDAGSRGPASDDVQAWDALSRGEDPT